MMHRKQISPVVLLIFFLLVRSNASLSDSIFRRLSLVGNVTHPSSNQRSVSPSLSPLSSVNSNDFAGVGVSNSNGEVPEPGRKFPHMMCQNVSNWCQIQSNNMTACLLGSEGSLLIQNDGGSSMKVKVSFLPIRETSMDIEVHEHSTKKINITEAIGVSSIAIAAGSEECVIYMGAPLPEANFYGNHATPASGAYILLAAAMIIAGTWACCNMRRKLPDVIPYQELEMGLEESMTFMNIETDEAWNQHWDDEWDEEKAVKSPP